MAARTAAWCDSPACTEGVKDELLGGTAANITESLKVILANKKKDGGQVTPPGKKTPVYCGVLQMFHT